MEERINNISCTFENPVQETQFLDYRWSQISKTIMTNHWFNMFSGMSILALSLAIDGLSIKLGVLLFFLQIISTTLFLFKDDIFRKNHSHKVSMPLNVLWVFIVTYGDFFSSYPDAIIGLPFIVLIYNLKLFPFNFLWVVIPTILCMIITLVYAMSAIQGYDSSLLPTISALYHVGFIICGIILIYDKWLSEKNFRIDYIKTQTIENTKKLMHKTLNRYFGDTLSNKLLSENGNLTGEIKWVTICFTDIASYSTIVEYMSPAVAVEFLNEYFTSMHRIIEKHGGQILNYIGDSIMIIFGAPNNQKNHEKISVECALEMREEMKLLNQSWNESELSRYWKNHGIEKITARIGIHTGSVIAGNIGSDNMLQYSAIGDVVNVASRLEQANKEFDTDICLSQEIHTALTSDLIEKSSFVGEINLKGRNAPAKVFTI